MPALFSLPLTINDPIQTLNYTFDIRPCRLCFPQLSNSFFTLMMLSSLCSVDALLRNVCLPILPIFPHWKEIARIRDGCLCIGGASHCHWRGSTCCSCLPPILAVVDKIVRSLQQSIKLWSSRMACPCMAHTNYLTFGVGLPLLIKCMGNFGRVELDSLLLNAKNCRDVIRIQSRYSCTNFQRSRTSYFSSIWRRKEKSHWQNFQTQVPRGQGRTQRSKQQTPYVPPLPVRWSATCTCYLTTSSFPR